MQNLVTKMKANYVYKITIYLAIPTFLWRFLLPTFVALGAELHTAKVGATCFGW